MSAIVICHNFIYPEGTPRTPAMVNETLGGPLTLATLELILQKTGLRPCENGHYGLWIHPFIFHDLMNGEGPVDIYLRGGSEGIPVLNRKYDVLLTTNIRNSILFGAGDVVKDFKTAYVLADGVHMSPAGELVRSPSTSRT